MDDNTTTLIGITTIDNPYDPFDDFTQWFLYDEQKGYHTCSYLARLTANLDGMTALEEEKNLEYAIDEIIKNDFRNIYKKIKK